MIREHKFVVDDAVVEFFARTKREREELLRVFTGCFALPKGRMAAKNQVRPGVTSEAVWTLVVRYWLDDPVLEIRVVDVEKVVP